MPPRKTLLKELLEWTIFYVHHFTEVTKSPVCGSPKRIVIKPTANERHLRRERMLGSITSLSWALRFQTVRT